MTRTRFAPSPTGYLHVGSLRTALFCYLLAKHEKGDFLVRIEDTDRTRLVDDAEQHFYDMLELFGIAPDESPNHGGEVGPYRQSDRLDIYKKYSNELIENKKAYKCFCTSERLTEVREGQESAGIQPRYDKHCRHLTPDEIQKRETEGLPYVVRLAVPEAKNIEFTDMIRGKIITPSADVDEQILMKSDGFPTYHFASVIDDYLMNITHIMLGDEWIPSGPKKKLIFDALGWEMPNLVFLPTILGTNKKKLSKRDGDTHASQFLEAGYLKEAILNYIALIGWNPKTTQEIFSKEELIEKFSVDGIQKASGIFDREKLEWMNAQYITAMDTDELYDVLDTYLIENKNEFYSTHWATSDASYNRSILAELQTRIKTLAEFPDLVTFFYEDISYDIENFLHKKMKIQSAQDAIDSLEFANTILDTTEDFSQEHIKELFIPAIKEAEKKNGQVLWPIRAALTGEQFSPGAFEMLDILGVEKSRERITNALDFLGKNK